MFPLVSLWTADAPGGGPADHGAGYLETSGRVVPLLWSMCFDASSPKSSWADDVSPRATCTVLLSQALEHLERRLPSAFRFLPAYSHPWCVHFADRLRASQRAYLHLDAGSFLGSEDLPRDEAVARWAAEWAAVYGGLDIAVRLLHKGWKRRLLGPGLPVAWSKACNWATGSVTSRTSLIDDVGIVNLAGVQDESELACWRP